MKLVSFVFNGTERIGELSRGKIIDLNYAYRLLLSENGELQPTLYANAVIPPNMNEF